MRHLNIDIETKSSIDIGKAGAYRYAQSEDFEIILFAYGWDGENVQVVDLARGEAIPEDVIAALSDPDVIKHAYNAAFEWWCLNQAGLSTPIEQWRCTMFHGLYCGYTAGLDATGKAIGLPQDKQKLTVGKALIRYFCIPCKPTKTNGGRTWNLPHHDMDRWNLFKDYCVQDVVTEAEILKRLMLFPVPEAEEYQWQMDVRMNAYGVKVDRRVIDGALSIDVVSTDRLTQEAVALTRLNNPNSNQQLAEWLLEKGITLDNLQKATVEEVLKQDLPADVKRVLKIRQQLSKTSVKKYEAMNIQKGPDDRIRGISQF
ncbi:MAG: hypothetical protein ACRDBO_07545, partial [Lachnospiraceae bacterium]